MTPEKLVKNFNRCADWEERYLYLIELGERLPQYPTSKQTDEYLVAGCQSKVWLYLTYLPESDKLNFAATSDAAIVKGLLALLSVAYHQKSPVEVKHFDVNAWFEQLELKTHLTPGRTQGLDAIVKTVSDTIFSLSQ
ncbi:SufE family protein [Vibrio sp. RE88]|uniref:SufE family protein n=1 Tax=Vibrio sp. RE88 TaxID=2607610 RepID=UPI001493DDB8|nr:SufE family protein [Vibrio sp. RE88]NOH60944.1 cysteine dioxygenase [Vibrio sp. RE88]